MVECGATVKCFHVVKKSLTKWSLPASLCLLGKTKGQERRVRWLRNDSSVILMFKLFWHISPVCCKYNEIPYREESWRWELRVNLVGLASDETLIEVLVQAEIVLQDQSPKSSGARFSPVAVRSKGCVRTTLVLAESCVFCHPGTSCSTRLFSVPLTTPLVRNFLKMIFWILGKQLSSRHL